MKSKALTLLTSALTALTLTHHATAALFSDDFNDGTIDSGLWQASTPFGDSSIAESGGNAVFLDRGRLLSLASFPTSIDLTGRFTITGNVRDEFTILTRTDGTSIHPSAEFDLGISFRFQIQNDTGSTANNVKIVHNGYPGGLPTLALGTFGLALNTPYDFRITDDGTNLALYINDLVTPFLTATDSTVFGNRLGIYNREGSGGGSSISDGSVTRLDYVQVVPEPSTAVFGALSALVLFLRRTRDNRSA
ncbi:MAG TPA: hypothetical protein VIT91_18115 [Chthoniobacterales bacterium]